MNPVFAVALTGGILALDQRSSIRTMISQPISAGILIGSVLGAWTEGLLAGALFQMIFLGHVHLRGKGTPDIPLGGIAVSALYILGSRGLGGDPSAGGFVLLASILAGVLVAGAGQAFYSWWEKASSGIVLKARGWALDGRSGTAATIHLSMTVIHFLFAFLLLFAVISAGPPVVGSIALRLPGSVTGAFGQLHLLIPFIGIGSLLRLYAARSQVLWFASGFLLTLLIVTVR